MPFVRTSRKSSDLLQFPMGGSKRDSAAPPEPSPPKQVTISDEARNDALPAKESMTVEELQAALDVPDSDSPKEESSRRKSAYDPNGPVEAVALDDDVQFWTTFIDLKTLGKGHFAKVRGAEPPVAAPSTGCVRPPLPRRSGPLDRLHISRDGIEGGALGKTLTLSPSPQVKEVQHAHTCEHFAVKILDKTLSDHDIEDMVCTRHTRAAPPHAPPLTCALRRTSATPGATCQVREFQMLRTLRHPNIIRLYGAYETPRKRARPDAITPHAHASQPCTCCL